MITHARGSDLYYAAIGHGLPVLCLPAFPFDSRMYEHQQSLADVARMIFVDYRGTGRSGPGPGPVSMESLANDMAGVLDRLAIDRGVILGVSMGGYVTFSLLAIYPERCRGFIFADTRAEADSPETAIRRRETVTALRRDGSEWLRQRVDNLFGATTHHDQPNLVEDMRRRVAATSAEGLAQLTMAMATRADATPLLAGIRVPTLAICGEEDGVTTVAGMRSWVRGIPRAQFVSIPRAGHLPPLEQPDLFNRHVRTWLARLPGKGG